MAHDEVDIARRFAAALDHDDYDAAAKFLHPACVYHAPQRTVHVAERIIDSYRSASRWARETFDELHFESDVCRKDDLIEITYTDRSRCGDVRHVYQCRQLLRFDPGGVVIEITHREIPGEREALDAFFARCNITKST